MTSFVVFTLSLLGTALFFDVGALYYGFYLCVGIYAWSRWYTPRSLRSIRVQRDYQPNSFLGETVRVDIIIHNDARFAVTWLKIQEGLPWELRVARGLNEVVSIAGRSQVKTHYSIRARRRGLYRIGPLFITTGDLFGLTPEQVVSVSQDFITVYPRLNAIDRLNLPSRLPFGTLPSARRLFTDPMRPAGIRNYQAGDSLRQINWKATGHTGELKVKTYQSAKSMESMILLNLHPDDYSLVNWLDGVEWGIELAASLAAYLVPKKQAVGLITNGMDPFGARTEARFDDQTGRLSSTPGTRANRMPPALLPRTGRAQLMRILELLARIEGARNQRFAHWVGRTCTQLGWGVTVFIITPTSDEATCHAIANLARSGFNPILIVTEPIHFAPVRQRSRQLGFLALQLTNRRDLDDWRRPRRAAL